MTIDLRLLRLEPAYRRLLSREPNYPPGTMPIVKAEMEEQGCSIRNVTLLSAYRSKNKDSDKTTTLITLVEIEGEGHVRVWHFDPNEKPKQRLSGYNTYQSFKALGVKMVDALCEDNWRWAGDEEYLHLLELARNEDKRLTPVNPTIERTTIIDTIYNNLQLVEQWAEMGDHQRAAFYQAKATALIELLEVDDCRAVGGFDSHRGQSQAERSINDRAYWLSRLIIGKA